MITKENKMLTTPHEIIIVVNDDFAKRSYQKLALILNIF